MSFTDGFVFGMGFATALGVVQVLGTIIAVAVGLASGEGDK